LLKEKETFDVRPYEKQKGDTTTSVHVC